MAISKFMVSACVAGINCRYDGQAKLADKIFRLVATGKALPFCPEQLAGLSTPRRACILRSKRGKKLVISSSGEEVTQAFTRGALLSWRIANRFKIGSALLKEGSPSCGSAVKSKQSSSGGVTFSLLEKKGIKVACR